MAEHENAQIEVRDDRAARRYVVRVDGTDAGYAAYRVNGDQLVFTHTRIDPAFEGRGVGSALAKGALDDVRRRRRSIVPLCPFISRYVQQHPEYADLVDD